MNSFEILKTKTYEDRHDMWSQVSAIDGNVSTDLFLKRSEPNNFHSVFNLPGDKLEEIRSEYENKKGEIQ